MKSAGKYDVPKIITNAPRPRVRYYRIRYRDRIWCLRPETWLAISFTLFVLGLSLLNVESFVPDEGSEEDKEIVSKAGAIVLFLGWAVLMFLIENIRRRDLRAQTHFRARNTPVVGVSIPPPIHQEWISASLLPRIERGWTAVEAEPPSFQPGQFEIAQPPTPPPAIIEKDSEDNQLSASKKKRNRKKKSNIQVSEMDETKRQTEMPGQAGVFDEIANDEQPGALNQEGQQPQYSGKIDTNRNAYDGEGLEGSDEVCGEQKDSHRTPSSAMDANKTSAADRSSSQTSELTEGPHQTSCQSKESQQASGQQKCTLQTFERVKPEKTIQTSTKITVSNIIVDPKVPKQPLGNKSEQTNETSTQSKDSILDHPEEPKENSGGMQLVGSNVASNLDSQPSTSKKRNRRRRRK